MTKIYRASVLLLIAGSLAFAQQVLTLTTGTQLQGRYVGGDANTIKFIDQQGSRHKINISQIQSLVFSGPLPTADGFPDGLPYTNYEPNASPLRRLPSAATSTPMSNPRAGWSRTSTIPAGTEIMVRTIDPIDVRAPGPAAALSRLHRPRCVGFRRPRGHSARRFRTLDRA